ncbi:MAG: four helix bundle protein, partial [Paludibacteraceae bacterium]|nr:four helix bundle protein [Paludibacteraceae bacterium]
MQSYRKLKVWSKSHDLTIKIYKITESFPDSEKYGLSSQMRRSAYSI